MSADLHSSSLSPLHCWPLVALGDNNAETNRVPEQHCHRRLKSAGSFTLGAADGRTVTDRRTVASGCSIYFGYTSARTPVRQLSHMSEALDNLGGGTPSRYSAPLHHRDPSETRRR